MKVIPLTKNRHAIVDDEDYQWLSRHKWHYLRVGYAARSEKGKIIYMHRVIAKTPNGMITDHIDMNGLNNTRSNLRICNKSQNGQNTKIRIQSNKSSKYKGVTWHKLMKRWWARIYYLGSCHSLGYFDTEEGAAKAYNKRASELFGKFANLNTIA